MKICFFSLFLICILSACGDKDDDPAPSPTPPKLIPERVIFSGAGDLGIFDPSIERDPGTGRLWMSYSSVDSSIYYPRSVYWGVSVRLAYSDDNGTSWQDADVVVGPKQEMLLGPLPESDPAATIPINSKGTWQSETSSLIYDPSAPIEARWKLIWFQYLHANSVSYFADYSWIALKTAATPLGLATASPIKLFGGLGLRPESANTVAPTFAPTGGVPAIRLNTDLTQTLPEADLAELSLCVFAEPGLHATTSSLYLTIFCADVITMPATKYLVHFRCSSPCDITNAANWQYLGRLLTPADAQVATDLTHFQAPDWVEKDNKMYLLTTPVDTNVGDRYDGCRLYELDPLTQTLRRENGQLIEYARVDGEAMTHHGACAAYQNLVGGVLLSQFDLASLTEKFKIYKSQVGLP